MQRMTCIMGVMCLVCLGGAWMLAFGQNAGEYRLRGDAVRPEFANMSGVLADGHALGFDNISAFRLRSVGHVSAEPTGETTVKGELPVETDNDPLTLTIVCKPANSTTLAMRQGDIIARRPQADIWPNDTSIGAYLLWTK